MFSSKKKDPLEYYEFTDEHDVLDYMEHLERFDSLTWTKKPRKDEPAPPKLSIAKDIFAEMQKGEPVEEVKAPAPQ